ncbi:hypothetical protein Trydic_g14756 [Trypoxylus dichotomus]
MFIKIYLISALACLAHAGGNLAGYSGNYVNGNWLNGYGQTGLNKWNGWNGYNNYYNNAGLPYNSNYYSGKSGQYPNYAWNRYNNNNGWNGDNGWNGLNRYSSRYNNPYGYGSATSYANSNLQSYAGYGYGYGKNYPYNQYYNSGNSAYPHYNFKYNVNDAQTGDQKYQQEQREGDQVWGTYGLKEADGTTREVKYQADDRNGFNAVVSKTGVANHPY